MKRRGLRIFACLLALLAAPIQGAEDGEWDWGFLASRQRDVDGRMRWRALGPFFEFSEGEAGESLVAIRPLYASERKPAETSHYRDFLWPLGTSRVLGRELSWRFLLAYGHRFDITDPRSRYRLWVLPVYFQGRDAEGRFYMALFPLGGRISDILFQDRVDFALFPLWARTEQAKGEVTTQHVFWPLYARTRGKGIDRLRVFPFYGRNVHRLNYDKRFILWPIWTDVRHRHPQASGYGYILWPLWSQIHLSDQKTWMLFPPIIRRTQAQQLHMFTVWPFLQWSSGKESRLDIWPLWGRMRRAGFHSSYLLWPIARRERLDRGDAVHKSDSILPLLQLQSVVPRGGDGPAMERHVRIWPLASYHRDGESSHLRIPDLWPTRSARPVNRSWAPIWTLFDRRTRGDARRTEILWGFFRRQTRGEDWSRTSLFPLVEWESDATGESPARSWSLLKGLFARSSSKTGAQYRMLYVIRWRTQRKDAETP